MKSFALKRETKIKQFLSINGKLFGLSTLWVFVSILIAFFNFTILDNSDSFELLKFINTNFFIWFSLAFLLDMVVYTSCKNNQKIGEGFVLLSTIFLVMLNIILLINQNINLAQYLNLETNNIQENVFYIWVIAFLLFKTTLLNKQKCL